MVREIRERIDALRRECAEIKKTGGKVRNAHLAGAYRKRHDEHTATIALLETIAQRMAYEEGLLLDVLKDIQCISSENLFYHQMNDILYRWSRKIREENLIERIQSGSEPLKTTVLFLMSSKEGEPLHRVSFSGNPADKEINNYFEEQCGGVYRWWRSER